MVLTDDPAVPGICAHLWRRNSAGAAIVDRFAVGGRFAHPAGQFLPLHYHLRCHARRDRDRRLTAVSIPMRCKRRFSTVRLRPTGRCPPRAAAGFDVARSRTVNGQSLTHARRPAGRTARRRGAGDLRSRDRLGADREQRHPQPDRSDAHPPPAFDRRKTWWCR